MLLDSTEVVSQVEFARGLYSTQDAFGAIGGLGHKRNSHKRQSRLPQTAVD
jgi:hypothetical protein